MTPTERAEAELLLANGMLHARMLPLLRAAIAHIHQLEQTHLTQETPCAD